jgi:hypothetical protein
MSRENRKLENNFWIIGSDPVNVIPPDCPLCKLSMRELKDVQSYEAYEACFTCKIEIIEPNLPRYNMGWRPGNEEIDAVRQYESTRPSYLMK